MPLLSGDRAAPHNPWSKTLNRLPDSSPKVHLLGELAKKPMKLRTHAPNSEDLPGLSAASEGLS